MHSLAPGDFGIAQSAGATDPYPFGPGLHGAEDGLFHGPAIGYTALYLVSDGPGYQKCVQLGLPDLLYIQTDFLAGQLFKMGIELVHPLAPPSDDDAGTGGIDGHRYLFGLPVDLHPGDGGVKIFGLYCPPDGQIFL